jgi:hypothetical protein
MNEREATQLLERLGGMLDVSGAPVDDMVDAGRRASARRRHWQIGGAAAAGVVVVVSASLIAQSSPTRDTAPATSTNSTSVLPDKRDHPVDPYRGQVPSESQLVGTWRPIRIGDGPRIDDVRRSVGSPLLLSFRQWHSGIAWSGYDGCNWTSGRVHLIGGSFSTSQNATTTRGCIGGYEPPLQPTIPDIVDGSASVTLDQGRLRFYGSDGHLLAIFVRTTVDMY